MPATINDGDTVTLRYEAGKWHIAYRGAKASDSPEGSHWQRHSPYDTFDDAVAAFKRAFNVGNVITSR